MGQVNVWGGSLSSLLTSIALRAPLASPTLTGIPTAPTAAVGTNTTQLATTAFVLAQAGTATPLVDGTASVGTATKFAREDHRHPTDTTRAPLASPAFTGTVTGITAAMVGLGNVTNESKATMFTNPALTGTPTAPTAAAGTNTTQIATTAFVAAAIAGISSLAPLASPAFTGTPTAPTATAGTNTTQIATTAFVNTAIAAFAPTASPAFTGTPTAPTAAVGTNTTQIATTAFVLAQAATANPTMDGTAAPGVSTKFAREDHVHPADTSKAPITSPAFTGTPTAPTAAVGTNTTQIATTAFVRSLMLAAGSTTIGTVAYNGTTASAGQFYGGTTNPTNTTRLNFDGYLWPTRVYNPAYADLAEYMPLKGGKEVKESGILKFGDILSSTSEGLVKAKYGDKNVVGVYSDTYGWALNADDIDNKVPVGLCGRVKVHIENPEMLEPGSLLVAGNDNARIEENPKMGTVIGKVYDCVPLEDGRYWMIISLM